MDAKLEPAVAARFAPEERDYRDVLVGDKGPAEPWP